MTWQVRDGQFDIAIAAGPGLSHWPSVGMKAISTICADLGLTVGWFGGTSLEARGVLPHPGSGGILIAEDAQHRIHRIDARAIIQVIPERTYPNPFPGSWSEGLLPIATAEILLRESVLSWSPLTVIIGTGNRALRFGSTLLEREKCEVLCVENYAQWKGKRFSGWEVEKRRFESLGGKIIEGIPSHLSRKDALIWELKVKDSLGVRLLDVARVVSAGPFRDLPDVREHPSGSGLYEFVQTSQSTQEALIEGWNLEEERGRWLGAKIARILIPDLGDQKEHLEKIYKRARIKLKRMENHQESPFTPAYRGKWMNEPDARTIREFSGVPKDAHLRREVASIECIEDIACNLCERACPESAIQIQRHGEGPPQFLIESKCTACGSCLTACPSRIPVILQEHPEGSVSKLKMTWNGPREWTTGEFAQLVNRRGDPLGAARVSSTQTPFVSLDVPTHLLWEARGLRKSKATLHEDPTPNFDDRVEITLNGDRRFVRENLLLSLVLFEIGRARPGDTPMCADGSCGLCTVYVDGVKKLACQTKVRRGMALKLDADPLSQVSDEERLCPCLEISTEQVVQRIRKGRLSSPEAVVSVTGVTRGKCHGGRCTEPFKRLLVDLDLDVSKWIDWRFPSKDWILGGRSHGERSQSPSETTQS